jgi:hypothetical protein
MKLKLPPFIETFIVKFALSKSGPFIQKGVSFLAAYIVAFLSQKVPGIEAHLDVTVLTGILWAVIDNLLGLLPAEIIKRYGREIQLALAGAGERVKLDGLALSKTAEATRLLSLETRQIVNSNKNKPKATNTKINTSINSKTSTIINKNKPNKKIFKNPKTR